MAHLESFYGKFLNITSINIFASNFDFKNWRDFDLKS
jgi:hypothetical protein